MKKLLGALLTLLALSATTWADQAAWITKANAEKGAALLKNAREVKHFCAPCGDKEATLEAVTTVAAQATGTEEYWEVQVNGKGIDLAYVYFLEDGRWKNVAVKLGIEVVDVPTTAP